MSTQDAKSQLNRLLDEVESCARTLQRNQVGREHRRAKQSLKDARAAVLAWPYPAWIEGATYGQSPAHPVV